MAEAEERQFNSLAERIAALNQQKNFSSDGSGPKGKRAPPPPPPSGRAEGGENGVAAGRKSWKPPQTQQNDSRPSLPRRPTSTGPGTGRGPSLADPPPLPSRRDSEQLSPALPPRRPSRQTLDSRRGSTASELSLVSTISNRSLNHISSHSSTTTGEGPGSRKLPPPLDQAKLPPLPPTRREREAKEAAEREKAALPIRSIKSAPIVPQDRPKLPPRLPSRPIKSPPPQEERETPPALPRRHLPPPITGFTTAERPTESRRSSASPRPEAPPAIPISSRPTAAQLDAYSTRAAANAAVSCLVCRDYSRPDAVAAQYPAQSIPRNDPVGYLANALCGPFPSATDKARAIFAWCHHNIAYNVEEFFGHCVKGRSVEETIFYGKAVCQGYAEVYQAIARRAGLECIVVGGHGKGYGFTPLQEDQAPPPRNATGHAWNAVRIDNGEWKLIDACWGAGSVGNGQFNKHFTPEMFCLSNDFFGLKHFPEDQRYFFRSDGRIPSWEEYIVGPTKSERAQWFGTATDEGISEFTFAPAEKHLRVNSNEVIRFQFSKICQHWVPEKHGRGKNYLLLLATHGIDGRKDELIPLESDGFWWWIDVRARQLGAPGQKLFLYGLETLDNKNARGVTKEEFLAKNGRVAQSWHGYVMWELV